MLVLYRSDVSGLVDEIITREPLVKQRSEQLTKLIFSEICITLLHCHDHITLKELQQKLSQPLEKKFYSIKVLRAHILPLTNVAFNKSGSW